MRPALVASLALVAGCSVRAMPYRFAAPLVSTVAIDGLPPAPTDAPPPAPVALPPDRADVVTPPPAPATTPRALTGLRDPRDEIAFALAVSGRPGAATDLDGLVALATSRGALAGPDAAIAPCDLLVFSRLSLVAVALGRDERGVVEMLYVARGVVRRGFVDPAHPLEKRDQDGRIVNTFVRHTHDEPPAGTKDLAGALLDHVIHTGEL